MPKRFSQANVHIFLGNEPNIELTRVFELQNYPLRVCLDCEENRELVPIQVVCRHFWYTPLSPRRKENFREMFALLYTSFPILTPLLLRTDPSIYICKPAKNLRDISTVVAVRK